MRREPDPLAPRVGIVVDRRLRPVAAPSLPCPALPRRGHHMLTLVSAERNSHSRIIAPLQRPLASLRRDFRVFHAIERLVPTGLRTIRRIEESGGEPLL